MTSKTIESHEAPPEDLADGLESDETTEPVEETPEAESLDEPAEQTDAQPETQPESNEQEPAPESATDQLPEKLRRVLKLQVPVVVCLSEKKVELREIMRLGVGSIIEFDRSCNDPLQLRVNDCAIGLGEAVKVGESFGLKVTTIFDPRTLLGTLKQ